MSNTMSLRSPRSISVENKSDRRPFKPKKPPAWSHMDDLHAAVGKTVRVMFSSDSHSFTGTLIAVDAYTIKVRLKPDTPEMILFKQGIEYCMVLSPQDAADLAKVSGDAQ